MVNLLYVAHSYGQSSFLYWGFIIELNGHGFYSRLVVLSGGFCNSCSDDDLHPLFDGDVLTTDYLPLAAFQLLVVTVRVVES